MSQGSPGGKFVLSWSDLGGVVLVIILHMGHTFCDSLPHV